MQKLNYSYIFFIDNLLIVFDAIIFDLVFFCDDMSYLLLYNSFRQYIYVWDSHCLGEAIRLASPIHYINLCHYVVMIAIDRHVIV